MSDNITQFQCLECNEVKSVLEFKKWAIRLGQQLYCKECCRKFTRKRHNDKNIAYRKKYYSRSEIKERQKVHAIKYWKRLRNDPERFEKVKKNLNRTKSERYAIHTFLRLERKLKQRDKKSLITASNLWHIAKKQNCRCALTGRRLTNENISPDHIICLSHGGKTEVNNIRLVTKESNVARNCLSDTEFIQLCMDVVEYRTRF